MPDPKPIPGGRPLDPATRKKLEAAFGADLSSVRVHRQRNSVGAAVGAKAYSHGENIFFAPGAYAPNTPHGQRLLTHEVAHVLQQRKLGPDKIATDPAEAQKVKRIAEQALKRLE